MSAVVDFTPEERSFLCGPHAEAALSSCGVFLEDLRPRPVESFDEPREMRAATHEKRRVYQWRLVRQECAKLEEREDAAKKRAAAEEAKKAEAMPPPPSTVQRMQTLADADSQAGPGPSLGGAAQRAHELALRQMVQRETRALERELRAEKQRQRLEDKQRVASEARASVATERERQRAASRESREFLSDVRSARRELEAREARPAGSARSERPASAPPSRPASAPVGKSSARGDESLSGVVRQRAEAAQRQREREIAAKMASKEAASARKREDVENERAMKRLYAEQMRLRKWPVPPPSHSGRLPHTTPNASLPIVLTAAAHYAALPAGHEERLAGVQLAALEHTVKQQKELEERQGALSHRPPPSVLPRAGVQC